MHDLIERQAAMELKPEFLNPKVNRKTEEQTAIDRAYARGWNSCNTHWIKEISELPSAQRTGRRMDLIDRQRLLVEARKLNSAITGRDKPFPVAEAFMEVINRQPIIDPERKTGRWIDHAEEGYVECPYCHSATNCNDNISDLHFCFSCGARMEGG